MNYQEYINLIKDITDNKETRPSYTNSEYLGYIKLNFSRMNRWQKTLQLNEGLVTLLKNINKSQKWIIIVEPWCGDAAPTIPFLVKLAEQNPYIKCDLQLRDQEPFLINSYLTNKVKSIPKLIVRDAKDKDLFIWGPRPSMAQQLVNNLKAQNTDYATLSLQLQNWYNKDRGDKLQKELMQLIQDAFYPDQDTCNVAKASFLL